VIETIVAPEDLRDCVASRLGSGYRPLTLVGTDDRAAGEGFAIHPVLLGPGGATLAMRAPLDRNAPRYPSLVPIAPGFHWDEREAQDLLGIVPEGHPDPRRLVLRAEWPPGHYPLRKDFRPDQIPPLPRDDSFDGHVVGGHEVTEVPVGPIHAGIIEPGHFRFSTVGESILHLDAQLFYTHRGLEKIVEGHDPLRALAVAERCCAACTVSHAAAFSLACEDAAEVTASPRGAWGRAVLLEMERLYNHVGDAGNMCSGGAFAVGAMTGARLKETVQRALDRLTGHRFGRGALVPGGLRRDIPMEVCTEIRRSLGAWRARIGDFRDLVLGSDGFVDRMRRTGVLSAQAVRDLGGVGVLARAAGVDVDLRRDRSYSPYDHLSVHVPTQSAGDAEARFLQRIAEALETLEILRQLLDAPPAGPIAAPVPTAEHPGAIGLGAVESPRGACVHWLRLDGSGAIDRLRIRSASFANWPIVPLAAPGNLVPDFPMINKSFELCYACCDR